MMHKDLAVYKLSMRFVKKLIEHTDGFPRREVFPLVAQIRRAAISILINNAEGAARNTTRDYIHILYIAPGSAAENDIQFELSHLFGCVKDEVRYEDLVQDMTQLWAKLIQQLKALQWKLIYKMW